MMCSLLVLSMSEVWYSLVTPLIFALLLWYPNPVKQTLARIVRFPLSFEIMLAMSLCPEVLSEMMTEAGFTIQERKYVQKETVNYKEDICVPRIFIQGRFSKPLS